MQYGMILRHCWSVWTDHEVSQMSIARRLAQLITVSPFPHYRNLGAGCAFLADGLRTQKLLPETNAVPCIYLTRVVFSFVEVQRNRDTLN